MSQTVKINNATYENVPKVEIPLATGTGSATFWDTTGGTATEEKILAGETAHSADGPITGTMPNIGNQTETIAKKADTVTISKGFHDGTGKVSIAAAEQAKIISDNIKAGTTILGVAGSSTVVDTADATAAAGTIVSGSTAYVAGQKVAGTLTLVKVTQDSTTKALSIA